MVVTTVFIIAVTTITSSYTANILAVFPHYAFSHHLVILPYVQELANRGHNVTLISNYQSEHPNITDISIRGSMPIYNNQKEIGIAKLENDIMFSINIMKSFYVYGKNNGAMFTVDRVRQLLLLNDTSKYDLLVTENFNSQLPLIFASKFNVPFIMISSLYVLPWNQHAVGQPPEVAVKPATLSSIGPEMNLYNRTMNAIVYVIQLLSYLYFFPKRDEEIIKQQLGIDVTLDQLISNVSLIFVNTHFTMFEPIPYAPSVIEIGGIHIKPATPLPTDIQKYIDEAEHGVIYFCLGSLLRGETMSVDKKKMFLNVFEKIPQRILWKWEGEINDKPPNVMISKWMPQRSILAHPNVKLFISHGGLMGTTEAVYESVPILALPIFGDQITNTKSIVNKGVAEMLSYDDLNEDDIFRKITSMISDPVYKQKAKKLSEVFRDRPMSPLQTAMYWTEYIIKHKGAPHLRSAAVGMPWYKYYLVDVLLVIISLLLIVFIFVYYSILKICLLFTNKTIKEKQT